MCGNMMVQIVPGMASLAPCHPRSMQASMLAPSQHVKYMTACCWWQVVGDHFGMGMDDTHIKMRGAPVLDEPALSPHSKMIADKLTVSELMSMAIVALPPVVRVGPLLLLSLVEGHLWHETDDALQGGEHAGRASLGRITQGSSSSMLGALSL